MSEADDTQKPGLIRQEGPHRVKVAPGSQSALAPSVGLSKPGLRPAVGQAASPVAAGVHHTLPSAGLRHRQGGGASVTEVRRMPGRTPISGRFAPGQVAPSSAPEPAQPSAWDQRLAALAELNARTLSAVQSFEAEVKPAEPVQPAASPARDVSSAHRLRNLFKRRSS